MRAMQVVCCLLGLASVAGAQTVSTGGAAGAAPVRELKTVDDFRGTRMGELVVRDIGFVERDGRVIQTEFLGERPNGELVSHYEERLATDRPIVDVQDLFAGRAALFANRAPAADESGLAYLRDVLRPADFAALLEHQGVAAPTDLAAPATSAPQEAGPSGLWIEVLSVTLVATPDGDVVVRELVARERGDGGSGRVERYEDPDAGAENPGNPCSVVFRPTCVDYCWGAGCPAVPPCGQCTGTFGKCQWLPLWFCEHTGANPCRPLKKKCSVIPINCKCK